MGKIIALGAWVLLLSGCLELYPELPDVGALEPVDMHRDVAPDAALDRGPASDADAGGAPGDMGVADMRPADMRIVDMRPADMRPVDMRPIDAARDDMTPVDMALADGIVPDMSMVDMTPFDMQPEVDMATDMQPEVDMAVEMDMAVDMQPEVDMAVDAACMPADEVCNGIDDDCDEAIDEGTGCVFCTPDSVGPPCNGCPPGVAVPDGWSCIPAGPGIQGSPRDENGHNAAHEWLHAVCLTRPYLIRQTELTRGEWAAVANLPSARHGCALDDCPVTDVNWYEVVVWLNALSAADGLTPCYAVEPVEPAALGAGCPDHETGMCAGPVASVRFDPRCDGHRLPTDAEWERAARAGVDTAYLGGDDPVVLDRWGWHDLNSGGRAHLVGGWQANAFGLYDVHGNAAEWVFDQGGAQRQAPVTDPYGPASSRGIRNARSGDFTAGAFDQRLARSVRLPPTSRSRLVGIRQARSLQDPAWRVECPPRPRYPDDESDICDGADDDGDGRVDEGWPLGEPCARPGNGRGVLACSEAGGMVCVDPPADAVLPEPRREETCDGWDDDWDGVADERLQNCLRCDGRDTRPPCNGCPAGLAVARSDVGGFSACIPPGVHERGGAGGEREVWVGPLVAQPFETLRGQAVGLDVEPSPSCLEPGRDLLSPWVAGWRDALVLANALGASEGLPPCYAFGEACEGGGICFVGLDCPGYRLPTEVEWEYMAFADAQGDVVPGRERPCGPPEECDDPDAPGPGVVGGQPSGWGLASLFGGVWEYTHDRWSWRVGEPPWVVDLPEGCPQDGPCESTAWVRLGPLPPAALVGRRGGGYDDADPESCFADHRSVIAHDNDDSATGVRLVRTLRRPDLLEPCNGIDDDLDGWLDEVHISRTCIAGVGACTRSGHQECTADGEIRCLAVPGEPAEAEDCDGIDDDCDGAVDETHECDPDGPNPICDRACRPCLGDPECGPDRICVGGACRTCDPATRRGCGRWFCDAAEDICRPCAVDGECGGLRCFGGLCQSCDPDTGEGCGGEVCYGGDECAPCADDADCGARAPCQGGLCTGG